MRGSDFTLLLCQREWSSLNDSSRRFIIANESHHAPQPGKPSALRGSRIQSAIRSATFRQRVVQLLSQASLPFENNDLAVVANWQEANRKRGVSIIHTVWKLLMGVKISHGETEIRWQLALKSRNCQGGSSSRCSVIAH